MKTFKMTSKIWIMAVAAILVVMTSCKKELDTPPLAEPVFTLPAGATLMTIADFKATPAGTVTDEIYITGTVCANDISGNIYKYLFFQDTTGGIGIGLDKICLYNIYSVGQRIYVKCKGLDFRFVNSMPYLGIPYNGTQAAIPEDDVDKYVFRDGLSGATPDALLHATSGLTDNLLGMLVRFDSVSFADAGETFNSDVYQSTQNRIISDGTGDVTLRISGYANFHADTIPSGKGRVYGILTKYNTTWQLLLRDINDVVF